MAILGMIGGVAPPSTIAYYHQLVASYRERVPDGSYPRIIINSIDLQHALRFLNAGDLDGLADFLTREIARLHLAGATFGILASNTPHVIFAELQRRSPIPLISIVEATAQKAKSLGLRRLGLFGSRFTMRSAMYSDTFRSVGLEIFVPGNAEQELIHDKYMNEIVHERFLPETRAQLLGIAEAMIDRHGIDGLILGGTELPLLLTGPTHRGVPLLDTTAIHVETALDRLLANRAMP